VKLISLGKSKTLFLLNKYLHLKYELIKSEFDLKLFLKSNSLNNETVKINFLKTFIKQEA
jgi:hypothetical protein